MINFTKRKLLVTCFTLMIFVSSFSIHQVTAWDSTKTWVSQATGCIPQPGNVNVDFPGSVYLGIGQTVPTSISSQYSGVTTQVLEAWKTNMVGMTLDQFKSFMIPASQAYTNPSATLYGKDLYFEVTITGILNDDGSHVTTRNSVINVKYSLFTDCQEPSTGTLTSTSSKVVPPDNSNLYFFGGLAGIIVIGVASYLVFTGRKTNINTDQLLTKTKQKESQNIQSLKESLETTSKPSSSSVNKKQSSMRRRR